jgi:cation diffusion facilitator CzcD-associated flavoprotein CzcO
MSEQRFFAASAEEIAELGFDPDRLLAKYKGEIAKRLRPEGIGQYMAPEGDFRRYGADPHVEPGFSREPISEELDVVIIGGGVGGLSAAARLRAAGVEKVRVIEIGGDFGGAWYWNRYPGVRCDIESYVYMPLLEETGYMPTEKYASGQEILDHLHRAARHFNLYEGALFQTQVVEARWNDDARRWLVKTDRGDQLRARFVIKTNSALDRPKLPRIPGIDRFAGKIFHTSRWDYDYTGGDAQGGLANLRDKAVAVIGTGCTAIQCVPYLAQDAGQLFVFQRTPSSVDWRKNRPTDPDWAGGLTPGWQDARRRNFVSLTAGGHEPVDMVDDAWTATVRAVGGFYGLAEADLSPEQIDRLLQINDFKKMNEIRGRVEQSVTDRRTAEALKPWYRQFCKRPTFSDDYLPAFNRPNVTLVDTDGRGVDEIRERSIVAGGVEYPVDCIIFATGFEVGTGWAQRSGCEIHGRGGAPLFDTWAKEGIRTFHGLMTHGFPNFFHLGMIQAAVTYTYTFGADAHADHFAALIGDALDKDVTLVEASAEAEAEWVATVKRAGNPAVEFQKGCTPNYLNSEGNATSASAVIAGIYTGPPLEYFDMIRAWRENGRAGLIWEK